MRFPDDVSRRTAAHFRSHLPQLLSSDSYDWSLPLKAPTTATVSSEYDKVQDFLDTWHGWSGAGFVSFEDKHWHRVGLGLQPVPTKISTTTAEALASLARESDTFSQLKNKLYLLGPELAERAIEVLPLWRNLPDEECTWVPATVDWFRENPASGLRPRAVAVPGVHGKWLEHNARLIRHLLGVEDLGLIAGDGQVRFKIIDSSLGNGLADTSTPVHEAATLSQENGPRIALIVENKETFLSLNCDWPETVAI